MPGNEALYQQTRTQYHEAILAVEANIRAYLLANGQTKQGVEQVLDGFYRGLTSTSGTVWALLGDAEHPALAMPVPLMCMTLWALRTLHASLAGPGTWHDYPRMPDQGQMERTLRRLQTMEARHRAR